VRSGGAHPFRSAPGPVRRDARGARNTGCRLPAPEARYLFIISLSICSPMTSFSLFSAESTLYGCLATQHDLGHAGFARLLERFVTPEGVYAASPEAWKASHPRLSPAMLAS